MRAIPALLALALLAVPATAQHAEWLPSDTLLHVSIENWAGQKERFQRHPLRALWDAPEFAPFREAVLEEDGEDEEDDGAGARYLEVFHDHLKGDIVLALVPPREDDDRPRFMILADFGDAAHDVVRKLDEIEESTRDGDEEPEYREEEDFRGVEIRVSRKRVGEKERETGQFVHGGLLVAGDSVDVLRRALMRKLDGAEDSLANHTAFRGSRAALGGRPDVSCYAAASGWPLDDATRAVLAALGLDRVRAVRAHATLKGNGLRLETLVYAPGADEGIFKVLSGGVARLGPRDAVPPDVDLVWSVGLNVQKTFDRVLALLDRFQPGIDAGVRESLRQGKANTGVDFYGDVLGALGNSFSFTWLPTDVKLTPDVSPVAFGYHFGRQVLILWEVEDAGRLRGVLQRGLEAQLVSDAGEYLGTRIYQVGPAGVHLALLPDVAVQAADIEAVRAVLRRHGKDLDGIRAKAAFREVVGEMPERRLLFVYSDPHAPKAWSFLGLFFDMARDEEDAGAFGLLPPASFFLAYRTSAGLALDRSEHGLRLTAFVGMRHPDAK